MQSTASTVGEYIESLPEERQKPILELRKVIKKNLPKGFKEVMSYGMVGYVVPHSVYPAGYHCNPKLPLPYINIASQKNFITIYHMGIYGDTNLMNWFLAEYQKIFNSKPDMGKGCIRFKKPEQIPFTLIGELVAKVSLEGYLKRYETNIKNR
jgi:uncharacterized protein YdhG (YjbR/CyaY superfamily)